MTIILMDTKNFAAKTMIYIHLYRCPIIIIIIIVFFYQFWNGCIYTLEIGYTK